VLEAIVRRVHDHRAEAHPQREEGLSDGGVPHRWFEDLLPGRLEEEHDAVYCTVQRHRPDQQADHDDVGEKGEEVGCLAGALHPLADYHVDEYPADQQGQDQPPRRQSESILDPCFVKDGFPETIRYADLVRLGKSHSKISKAPPL